MTLFFNLANLEKEAGDDAYRFMRLFYNFFYKKLPTKKFRQPKLPLAGTSFLLNAEGLLKNSRNIDIYYVIQYIKLAGRRDYSFYKFYGTTSLQLSYYPDIDMDNIKSNPLLNITDTEIFFLYEDNKRK